MRARTVKTNAPATAPATAGTATSTVAPARVTIAATERTPARARATTPRGGRSACRMPAIDDAISTARARPTSRAILSYAPNVAIANSLNGCGTMSMTKPPTARIGLPPRPKTRASTSATARKTAALTIPETIAHSQNPTPRRLRAPPIPRLRSGRISRRHRAFGAGTISDWSASTSRGAHCRLGHGSTRTSIDESGWPSPHIAAEHEAQGRRIFEQVRRALPEHEVVFRYWERSHRES
jgi:hypothetical protein